MVHLERLASRDRGRWWPPFLAGAAAGALLALLARRPRDEALPGAGGGPGGRRRDRWDRWREAWDGAVEGAAEGLADARDFVMGRPDLDVAALQRRVDGMECAAECRVRRLGEGIVEVFGSCASQADAEALLAAVASEPGVEVVVNRVWTPWSSGPDGAASPH